MKGETGSRLKVLLIAQQNLRKALPVSSYLLVLFFKINVEIVIVVVQIVKVCIQIIIQIRIDVVAIQFFVIVVAVDFFDFFKAHCIGLGNFILDEVFFIGLFCLRHLIVFGCVICRQSSTTIFDFDFTGKFGAALRANNRAFVQIEKTCSAIGANAL